MSVESEDLIVLEFHSFCGEHENHEDCSSPAFKIECGLMKDWTEHNEERFYEQLQGCRVDILAERHMLERHSTYFRAFRSFREGDCQRLVVDCEVMLFLILLQYFYTGVLNLRPSKVVNLLETSLFFGVDEAICLIETWANETPTTSDEGVLTEVLSQLPCMWEARLRNGLQVWTKFCLQFLSINFIYASNQEFFIKLPYSLVLASLNHPQLTVDSEKRLLNALLKWLEGLEKECQTRDGSSTKTACLLHKVRSSLIPSKIMLAQHLTRNSLDDKSRTFRLTRHLKCLDLSGCHEVDGEMLFESFAAASLTDEESSDKATCSTIDGVAESGRVVSREVLSTQNFRWPLGRPLESLSAVEVSQCSMIPQFTLVAWLKHACPNVTSLVARRCPQIGVDFLTPLFKECPCLHTLDISLDGVPKDKNLMRIQRLSRPGVHLGISRPVFSDTLSNMHRAASLTCLSLRGRHEFNDANLLKIAVSCPALMELDVSMCPGFSDLGISRALKWLPLSLQSLRADWTAFGQCCSNVVSKMNSLQTLHLESCHGLVADGITLILSTQTSLRSLHLGDTALRDSGLLLLRGHQLQDLSVRQTKVSANAVCDLLKRNPTLKSIDVRGCTGVWSSDWDESSSEDNSEKSSSEDQNSIMSERSTVWMSYGGPFFKSLASLDLLEELKVGWSFDIFGLRAMKPSKKYMQTLEVGLGGRICSLCVQDMSIYWPHLRALSLSFQTINDDEIIKILEYFCSLQVLIFENSISSLTPRGVAALAERCPQTLKILKLDRFVIEMSDDVLLQLSKKCRNLTHFSLAGCKRLTERSLLSIAKNMSALTELGLEECQGLTLGGGESLLKFCKALECLILRHNGRGMEENFILMAMKELPCLWYLSLDLCDSISDRYEKPEDDGGILGGHLTTILVSECQRIPTSLFMVDEKWKVFHKRQLYVHYGSDRRYEYSLSDRI